MSEGEDRALKLADHSDNKCNMKACSSTDSEKAPPEVVTPPKVTQPPERTLPEVTTKEGAEALLSLKFHQLYVSTAATGRRRRRSPGPTTSETRLMGRKREWSKKSAKPPLLRRSKLSKAVKAEEWTTRESTHSKTTASATASREASTSSREASKASREALTSSREASISSREASTTTSTAASSQEDFSGPAFRDLSRNTCKRKRSTTPEFDEKKAVRQVSCGEEARLYSDINPDDLAGYLEVTTFFPKKMSYMAELMYT